MGKIIKFRPGYHVFQKIKNDPKPATFYIPEWYKKTPQFINNDIKLPFVSSNSNLTVKMCLPFLDALSCGYMITLPFDIGVTKNEPGFKFTWETDQLDFIDGHGPEQYPGLLIPDEFDKNAYKFNTSHIIETPPGYSLIFTHPFNRVDLPFYTFTGIVDSDRFNQLPVNIPFLIKKDFEGIIEKGTPIAQIIPIKREQWNSEFNDYNFEQSQYAMYDLKSVMLRSYKTRWWQKKKYL